MKETRSMTRPLDKDYNVILPYFGQGRRAILVGGDA